MNHKEKRRNEKKKHLKTHVVYKTERSSQFFSSLLVIKEYYDLRVSEQTIFSGRGCLSRRHFLEITRFLCGYKRGVYSYFSFFILIARGCPLQSTTTTILSHLFTSLTNTRYRG